MIIATHVARQEPGTRGGPHSSHMDDSIPTGKVVGAKCCHRKLVPQHPHSSLVGIHYRENRTYPGNGKFRRSEMKERHEQLQQIPTCIKQRTEATMERLQSMFDNYKGSRREEERLG